MNNDIVESHASLYDARSSKREKKKIPAAARKMHTKAPQHYVRYAITVLLMIGCFTTTDAFQLFQRSRGSERGSERECPSTPSESQDTAGADLDASIANVKGLMHNALDNLRMFEQSFFSIVPAIDEKKHDAYDAAPLAQLFSRLHARSAMDVVETDGEITFTADVPGVDVSSLSVEVVAPSNILSIVGERKSTSESSKHTDKNVLKRTIQRHSGQFVNKYVLPHNADLDGVKATISNGVLVVSVPKKAKEASRVRRVDILSSAQSDENV